MKNKMTPSTAWSHTNIKEIFPDVFFVTGMNKTQHEGIDLQHSRNMVILRHEDTLALINTVKLDNNGLRELEKLGKIAHVLRIGAFHGRDDAFYLDRYSAKLWAIPNMQHEHNKTTDAELITNGPMPFPNCSFFVFETTHFPEGIIHLNKHGGILITCDSVKNWVDKDEFFSEKTAKKYRGLGFFGRASISPVWQEATKVQLSDFIRLHALNFCHLLSAHGEPLLNTAHEDLALTISKVFHAKL